MIRRANSPISISSEDREAVASLEPFGRRCRLPARSMLHFLQARSLQHCENLENKSCQQINRVVCRCIPSRAVVVYSRAIESEITRVLHRKVDVLCGPPRGVQNIAITLRTPVGASRNRSLRKEQRIAGSGYVKQASGPR